jgi:hypothetical protein
LIMSASKNDEPSAETNTDIPVERMSVALQPHYFFQAVYPYDICAKLERNIHNCSSSKIDWPFSARWKSWGYNLCRAAVMDMSCDADSPTVSLKNLVRFQACYADELQSSMKRSEFVQCAIDISFKLFLLIVYVLCGGLPILRENLKKSGKGAWSGNCLYNKELDTHSCHLFNVL